MADTLFAGLQALRQAERQNGTLADVPTVRGHIAELITYLQQTSDEMREPDFIAEDALSR